MLIATQNTRAHINLQTLTLNGTTIEYTDFFDKNLAWDKHISICQKVYRVLNIEKYRAMTPEIIRLRLVKTLNLPYIDYCSFAYCNINLGQRKKNCRCCCMQPSNMCIMFLLLQDWLHIMWKPKFSKFAKDMNLKMLLMTHKMVH
jgi:hypothetical protein